jgi:hypothetical protein
MLLAGIAGAGTADEDPPADTSAIETLTPAQARQLVAAPT